MYDNCLNRDVSWLAFNERVLAETRRDDIPLQEVFGYFGITRSNLDEFIQTRYPATIDMYDEDGLENFKQSIVDHYHTIDDPCAKFLYSNNKSVRFITNITASTPGLKNWVWKYFRKVVYPTLQPVTLTGRKFIDPRGTINIFVITEGNNKTYMNYVEIPQALPRLVHVPNTQLIVPMEEIVMDNLNYLFKGVKIRNACAFRCLRSAEVYPQTDAVLDQYELIERTLKAREKSWITMLEIASSDSELVSKLKKLVPITDNTIVLSSKVTGFVGLSALKNTPDEAFGEADRSRKYVPVNTFPRERSVIKHIREKDRLVFHPYESYQDTFVRFITEAAEDPTTISIKITLYRVATKSRIIDALIKAAENGKQVTVLVELKARFDESHNIKISRILKEAGVRLVYGSPELKTHAKLCLVTAYDKHGDVIIYSHIGTGNYNESNAKLYTDYSYFTADQVIGHDLTRFFNLLTSTQEKFKSKKLFYAPYNLRTEIEEQIQKQVDLAKKGKKSRIIFKCNSLTDDKISKMLVDAADARVPITLIVRGACVVPYHKNIKVVSIVGRFLEHSRIYLFGYDKLESIYIGSNDVMHRNLNRRNELMLMVEPDELKTRIKKHLKMYMSDTECTHTRIADYTYFAERFDGSITKKMNCQQQFIDEAAKLQV